MNYQLEVLSPVHIGSRNDISPVEYIVNNQFYRIEMDELFKDKEFNKESFIQKAISGDFYLGNFTPDLGKKYPLYILNVDKYSSNYLIANKPSIKEFIKTGGFVYIPGSSIKGSILSAMYWHVLKKASNKDENIKSIIINCLTRIETNFKSLPNTYKKFIKKKWNYKIKKEEVDFIETLHSMGFYYLFPEEIRKYRIKEKIDRKGRKKVINTIRFGDWLEISDTNTIEPGQSLEITTAKVIGARRRIEILYEVLTKGTNFNFRIIPQKTLFSEKEVLEIVDRFYSKVLQNDIDFYSKNNIDCNLSEIENEKYKLKIGQGSTIYATSFLILASDLGIKKDYLSKWPLTKYKSQPKTRKIIQKAEVFNKPLGWAKLSIK